MKDSFTYLAYALFVGACYFFAVSIAHLLELKIPGLFVYFDVDSFEYQNKIIAMLAFGWAAFFYLGAQLVKQGVIKYTKLHLVSGIVGIVILSYTHTTKQLSILTESANTFGHWLVTGTLFLYLLLVLFLYRKAIN